MLQAGSVYKEDIYSLSTEAITLLQRLIATPSFSREEENTAGLIEEFLIGKEIPFQRKRNNIWLKNKYFESGKAVILLNSHHDTVRPNPAYTLDPFEPLIKDGKLYGLGSNDAGGAIVSLLAVFLHYYEKENLKYNFIYAVTAEEEISGNNGIETILHEIGEIDFTIVGEPTLMDLAIAEKGLLVLDCVAYGKAGDPARNEGENAIYKALKDIEWFSSYSFPKESELLGPVKMSVTGIHAGGQHNIIPERCEFTVDVRCTDAYSLDETLEIIRQHISSEIKPRSVRLRPSFISPEHPFVKAGKESGRKLFGSPTTSDRALIPYDSVKLGPGDSARSHTADEFIYIDEIPEAISLYIEMLDKLVK